MDKINSFKLDGIAMMVKTIGKFFQKRCSETPDNSAIGWIEKGQLKELSFKEYYHEIEKLSFALHHIGLKKRDKISIMGATRKEWHYFDLAALCSGGIVVPVYHTYLDHEVKFIVEHAESRFLIIENEDYYEKISDTINSCKELEFLISIEKLSESSIKKIPKRLTYFSLEDLVSIGKNEINSEPDYFENAINSSSHEDVATIIYTSGTTGTPKGAVITHGAFSQMLNNVLKFTHNALNEKDRALCFLPLSHVFGRCDSYLPLIFGWQTVYAESIENLVKNISLVKPSIMLAVPRIFEKIYAKVMEQIDEGGLLKKEIYTWATKIANSYYNIIDKDLTPSASLILQYKLAKKLVFDKIYQRFGGNIRYFISGGAPLSPEIIIFLRNAGLTVLEGYGLTETIAPCCLNPFTRQIPGTVGRPMGDVEIKFDTDGEILIKSKALFSEYYKNPEETKNAFVDEWFRTGDIGVFTEDGHLKITDRKKDIIITSGGKNIAPQKIENRLKLFPLISEILIIGNKRKYLSALIGLDKESLLSFCEENNLPLDLNWEELAQNEKVNQEIQHYFDLANKELASFESIKKFKILPQELTTENYLTPSLKLKKKLLEKDYQSVIDSMY